MTTSREQFEQWYFATFINIALAPKTYIFEKYAEGSYKLHHVQSNWLAWQSRDSEVEALEAKVNELRDIISGKTFFDRPELTKERDELRARVEELEQICDIAYQVVGTLSHDAGRFYDNDTEKVLDMLGNKELDESILPFASKPASSQKD